MNKKIFAIFLIAALLIISVGVISAADNQDDSKAISVKINWDDAAKISERPNQVKVNLIKDGNVVDTVVLSESNSWKDTFKASSDGTFKVQASDLDDYSFNVNGDANAGFVVTYSLKADVLGASDDEPVIEDTDSSDESVIAQSNESDDDSNIIGDAESGTDDVNDTNATGEDDNATDGETEDDNTTDEDINDTESADGVYTDGMVPTVVSEKIPVTKEKQDTHKIVKKPLKKHKIPKSKMRNTGLPIVALVVLLGIVAFVPFSRKK